MILVQNYSPCHKCVDEILGFKKTEEDITFSLTVKFANFYHDDKQENIEGLKTLLQNGVSLELLQGKDEWEDFLSDTTFFRLDPAEYNVLLQRATSTQRVRREEADEKIYNRIKTEAQGK